MKIKMTQEQYNAMHAECDAFTEFKEKERTDIERVINTFGTQKTTGEVMLTQALHDRFDKYAKLYWVVSKECPQLLEQAKEPFLWQQEVEIVK